MDLEDIPDELKDLNNLELHTICKRILFMKLVKLPWGKQKGIKGAAVNIPADLGPAFSLLPRIPTDAHIISLKLKRKLQYKQAYLHDTIWPEKVITALRYLKNNNPEYSDININENCIQTWREMDHELYDGVFDIEQNAETNQTVAADQVQISNDIGNINTYSSNVDPSDAEETDKLITEEEKEDMIAMEENCKLKRFTIWYLFAKWTSWRSKSDILNSSWRGKEANTTTYRQTIWRTFKSRQVPNWKRRLYRYRQEY